MYALVAIGTYSVIVWAAATDITFPLDIKLKEGEDAPKVHGTLDINGVAYNYHILSDYMADQRPFTQLFGAERVPLSDSIEAIIPDLSTKQFAIPLGVTVILAPTGWGKTVLVEEFITPALIDSSLDPVTVNYIEPFSATAVEGTINVNTPHELLARLGVALIIGETIVIDSFRAFVYGKGRGGTGSKGVDQLLYPQLTALNNAAINRGCRIVVTLNPMVTLDDTERYEEFSNSITASVSGAIVGGTSRTATFHNRGPTAPSREDAKVAIRVPDREGQRAQAAAKVIKGGKLDVFELGDRPTTLAHQLLSNSLSK